MCRKNVRKKHATVKKVKNCSSYVLYKNCKNCVKFLQKLIEI